MKRRILLMALLSLGACKKDEAKSEETSAAKAADSKAPAKEKKAAQAPYTIAKFGLKIDMPGETDPMEMGDSVLLRSSDPVIAITIDVPSEFSPADLAAAEKDAKETYSGMAFQKGEMEGGWWLTFENKGGMGTNYWVNYRTTIDGKAYSCAATAHNKEQQAASLAACKTLRK